MDPEEIKDNQSANQEEAPKSEQEEAPESIPRPSTYLQYHLDSFEETLELENTLNFLVQKGWINSSLNKARKGKMSQIEVFDPTLKYCSFCYESVEGQKFDRLKDGRIRCKDCGRTSIDSLKEFSSLAQDTANLMKKNFGIDFKAPIKVKTANAKKVHREVGMIFKPSALSRILGFATRRNGKNIIYVENGAPKLASMSTIEHELTHIWQHENWTDKDIDALLSTQDKKLYRKLYLLLLEGMAVWSEVAFLNAIGESRLAQMTAASREAGDNEYSIGFKLYRKLYPISIGSGKVPSKTPFQSFPPVSKEDLLKALKDLKTLA